VIAVPEAKKVRSDAPAVAKRRAPARVDERLSRRCSEAVDEDQCGLAAWEVVESNE
jgi:hypothetical protein